MDPADIEAVVEAALAEAAAGRVSGKALTPFLLAKVNELTGGRALAANVALIRNNAALAARVAVALVA
jgi:pseudouridine-5'-phosphate glycosidase